MFRVLLRDYHEDTINSVETLMVYYTILNLFEKAEPLALEVYFYMLKRHGKDHTLAQKSLKDLIAVLTRLEPWYSAVDFSNVLIRSLTRTLGEDHNEAIDAKETLSNILAEQDAHSEVEALRRTILEHRRRKLTVDDEGILQAMELLIDTFMVRRNNKEAELLNFEI